MGRSKFVVVGGRQVLDCICLSVIRILIESQLLLTLTMHLHVQLFVKHNTCINCMVVLKNMLGAEITADRAGDGSLFWVGRSTVPLANQG